VKNITSFDLPLSITVPGGGLVALLVLYIKQALIETLFISSKEEEQWLI